MKKTYPIHAIEIDMGEPVGQSTSAPPACDDFAIHAFEGLADWVMGMVDNDPRASLNGLGRFAGNLLAFSICKSLERPSPNPCRC